MWRAYGYRRLVCKFDPVASCVQPQVKTETVQMTFLPLGNLFQWGRKVYCPAYDRLLLRNQLSASYLVRYICTSTINEYERGFSVFGQGVSLYCILIV